MIRDFIESNGIKINFTDFGGSGQDILLLHGLMGRASTWEETANFLTLNYRVVAIDQRGHGLSDKPNDQYTRQNYVEDIINIIEQIELKDVIIIGHSLGALNGWVLTAQRPDLVRGLILVDMTSDTTKYKVNDRWKDWFDSWPIPFASIQQIRRFFLQSNRPADFFMESFIEKIDGYYPLFQFQHMLSTREDFENHDYSSELEKVECPTLVVRGGNSDYTREEIMEVANRIKHGEFIEIPKAGHFVHLDQPEAWQVAVESFLRRITK